MRLLRSALTLFAKLFITKSIVHISIIFGMAFLLFSSRAYALLPTGSACTKDTECNSGHCDSTADQKVCCHGEGQGLGEMCGLCCSGYTCNGATFKCESRADCASIGEECVVDAILGDSCCYGECNTQSNLCEKLGSGGLCDHNEDCSSGSCINGVCSRGCATTGSSCSINQCCEGHGYCNSSQICACIPENSDIPCSVNRDCCSGRICEEGRCVSNKEGKDNDQPCVDDFECKSGSCIGGHCADCSSLGGYCDDEFTFCCNTDSQMCDPTEHKCINCKGKNKVTDANCTGCCSGSCIKDTNQNYYICTDPNIPSNYKPKFTSTYVGVKIPLTDIIELIFKIMVPVGIGFGLYFTIKAGYTIKLSEGNPDKKRQGVEELTAAVMGTLFIGLSLIILRIIINTILGGNLPE